MSVELHNVDCNESVSTVVKVSGKTHFRSILYAIIYLFFMLRRLYLNLLAVFSWTLIGQFCRLYTSGGKMYFGLRPFSLVYLPLSLVVRLI